MIPLVNIHDVLPIRRTEPVMCDGTFQVAKVRFAIGSTEGRRLNGKCGICGQPVKAIVMSRHADGAVDTARICWHEIAGGVQ
jgi:hypothetical protein